MSGDTLTLLITRQSLPGEWLRGIAALLATIDRLHLFFLDRGTFLASADFSVLPPGRRVYCEHGLRTLNAPPAAAPVQRGGLFDLGGLLRESRYALSLPHMTPFPDHCRGQEPGSPKKIIIPLARTGDRRLEGLRLATGLAGCDHAVTIITDPPVVRDADTLPYLQTLEALGARFSQHPAAPQPGTFLLRI